MKTQTSIHKWQKENHKCDIYIYNRLPLTLTVLGRSCIDLPLNVPDGMSYYMRSLFGQEWQVPVSLLHYTAEYSPD